MENKKQLLLQWSGLFRTSVITSYSIHYTKLYDDYILLEKYDDYVPYGDPNKPLDGWAGYKHAYTDKIYLHYVLESATRVAGLQTGQYDVEFQVDDQAYATISNIPGMNLLKYKSAEVALVFNKKEGLGSDVNVRKAVITSYSIHYTKLYELRFGTGSIRLEPWR